MDTKLPKKVRVEKCSSPQWWYENRIGDEFRVLGVLSGDWSVDVPGEKDSFGWGIDKTDCTPIYEEEEAKEEIARTEFGEFASHVHSVCAEIESMLIQKNKAYGNSALQPLRIFAKSDTEEQLNVRIDDKLSRILRGEAAGEDVEKDLIGYLILKQVRRRMHPPTP